MDFERGKEDIKESIGIGKKANAIRIMGVFCPNREIMEGDNDYKKQEHLLKSNIGDKGGRHILEGIEKNELSSGWEDRYFVAYFEEPLEKSFDLSYYPQILFSPLRDLRESFIEFNGKKYLIP